LDLHQPCAKHFTWSDLLACGDTVARRAREGVPVGNIPLRDETWEGLASLATTLLDPLWDHFGRVEITYGFAGPPLTRHIVGGIAPSLDQHAGAELGPRGSPVCSRGGQSCDLRVPGVDAVTLAHWVAAKLPFDRMYLYGLDRPVHLSWSKSPVGKVFAMCPGGRKTVPRDVTRATPDEVAQRLRG